MIETKEEIRSILLEMISTNSCECIIGCRLCPVEKMCNHIPYLEFRNKKRALAIIYCKENKILTQEEIFEAVL